MYCRHCCPLVFSNVCSLAAELGSDDLITRLLTSLSRSSWNTVCFCTSITTNKSLLFCSDHQLIRNTTKVPLFFSHVLRLIIGNFVSPSNNIYINFECFATHKINCLHLPQRCSAHLPYCNVVMATSAQNNKASMLNHGKTGRFIKQLFVVDGQCFDKIQW